MSQMTLESFDDLVMDDFRDPEFAVAYLQDALDDSIEEFLRALGKYVKANGGIAKCSEKAGISREALYRMLSETGSPEFRSIVSVLKAHGLYMSIGREAERELVCDNSTTSSATRVSYQTAIPIRGRSSTAVWGTFCEPAGMQ